MPKVEILDWVWKTFGIGGLISIALGFAVYKLWKYVQKIHTKISDLHQKYNDKLEKMIHENQKRIDEINRTHEYRMDEMSKSYTRSMDKISAQTHEDHVRMELLIQGLHN